MASGGFWHRDGDESEYDLEVDIITDEEMASFCDVGNEQTWLSCSENIDPNSYVDLTEFLQVQSSAIDKERLYRTVVELETSNSGGVDTRTFRKPKKMSLYPPLLKAPDPERNICFQPCGVVNSRFNFISHPNNKKDISSLKDVTNSTYDTTNKKQQSRIQKEYYLLDRILDEYDVTDQTMISDTSSPSFFSISDSDDGMAENIPNVSINLKHSDSRIKRGKSVEAKSSPQCQPQFKPGHVSTPSSKYNYEVSSLDISDPLNSSGGALNKTISLDCKDEWLEKDTLSVVRSLQQSPAKSSNQKMIDSGVTETFNAFDRVDKLASPKSRLKLCGLSRLSHNNTFRLSKSEEPKHFKSVESGLNTTLEMPNHLPGTFNKDPSHLIDLTYSSTGNIPRSLGDVHLAAQQQEFQLRDNAVGMPNVAVPTLKSPMKKVLSENCIFSSKEDGKLRVASSYHGSVSNLSSNNNKDNNNHSTEFPTKISPSGCKKTLSSGLPVSTRPAPSRIPAPRSRIPSRLPTRMPRLQPGPPKAAPDWTDGCY